MFNSKSNMDTYYLQETDSFYYNYNVYYFNYDKFIVSIKFIYNENDGLNDFSNVTIMMAKYDCEKRTFIDYSEMEQIDKSKNLEHISGHICTLVSELYIFDCINNTYMKRSYPYPISEIDGNHITSCMINDHIYIFHSFTSDYDTGVFMYSIKSDTFNNSDFYRKSIASSNDNETVTYDDNETMSSDDDETNEKYTNRFTNLHGLNIISCYGEEDVLYILYNYEIQYTGIHVGSYDIKNDKLKELVSNVKYCDILVVSSNIIILPIFHDDNEICIHNIDHSETLDDHDNIKRILLNDKKQKIHQHIVNSTLFILREIFKSPYGQIYKSNHDDDCRIREMELKMIDIKKYLNK